jgi:hypothetical protein
MTDLESTHTDDGGRWLRGATFPLQADIDKPFHNTLDFIRR